MNALLLAACAAPVPLPAPTGALPIGQTTLQLVDRDRPESMAGHDVREVTVHLFYPAAPSSEAEPTDYVPDLRALRSALDRRTERLFRHVQGSAILDAPVAAEPSVFPVVVLSHGNDRLGLESTFLIEELASHGYAVAVLDHPYDARAVVLSDGRVIPYAGEAWPALPPPPEGGQPDPDTDYAHFYRERVEVRAQDARFVLDRLAADDPLAALGDGEPRLGLERVAFIGHSVGGVAAGSFCQEEPRAVAAVNLDGDFGGGPFYLQPDGAAFDSPFLMLTKPFWLDDEQLASWGLTREEWTSLIAAQRDATFGRVTAGSWRVVLDGATHESFTDEPFVLASLQGDDPSLHERHLEQIRAYVLDFLNRFLQDEPSPLLDGLPPEGVTVERWPSSGT